MKIRVCFLCLIFLFLAPLFAWAKDARIENLSVEMIKEEGGTPPAIIVSFALEDGFNGSIMRDIQDGIQKDFYYYVVLNQKQKHWFYEEIAEKTIRYTVKYDTLKKDYTVGRREGANRADRVFDSQEEMRAFISREQKIRLAATSFLKQDHRYNVWVKAQMKASHIPRDLGRFLFFIPFLDIDTPWAKSGSLYAPP